MSVLEMPRFAGSKSNKAIIESFYSLFISVIGPKKHIDTDRQEFEELSIRTNLSPEDIQEAIYVENIIHSESDFSITKKWRYVESAVESLDQIFAESLDLPPTNKKILCGSASNIDRISYLKNETIQQKIDQALKDALIEGIQLGKNEEQVIGEIEGIIYNSEKDFDKSYNKVSTKAEVIGFILRMFQQNGGKKLISDLEDFPGSGKKLGDWIGEVFNFESTKVGGAAAQTADFLKEIGEENVTVYTRFNSPLQANVYKNPNLGFLRVENDKLVVKNIKESAIVGDPTKICYPIERPATISVNFNGKTIVAGEKSDPLKKKSDRIIFTSEYYDEDGNIVEFNPLLNFTFEDLKKIGSEFEIFFMTGPYYLQHFSGTKYEVVSKKMIEQLKILRLAGTRILVEFSGNAGKVKYFPDVLRNNIDSLSMNDSQELVDIVNSLKTNINSNIEVDNEKGPYSNYKNAVSLANFLNLERLHIHGQNTDIVVRKNASEQDLESEVQALMFSKQRVTEHILGKQSKQKTSKDEQLTRILKEEGCSDVLQLAQKLSEELFPQSTPPSISIYRSQIKLIYSLIKKGYYKSEQGYSVAAIPVKWIYDDEKVKVTTGSGDITSITAAVHSGI